MSTVAVFIDVETVNPFLYPKGNLCQLAAASEIDNNFAVRATNINPGIFNIYI